jgi:hypothetical protein
LFVEVFSFLGVLQLRTANNMKKLLLVASVFCTGLVLDAGMSLAVQCNQDGENEGNNAGCGVPGPADSEVGLAGLLMAGGAAYIVWRRRTARKD